MTFTNAATPVASITTVGQDGWLGTVFGWLDRSYATGSAKIVSRTLSFKGNQNWQGYDRYGNPVSGTAGQTISYSLDNSPVQIMTTGTYFYQIKIVDSTGGQNTSSWQSFSINSTNPNTSVNALSSTGADGAFARVGFSVTQGSKTVNSNGGTLYINRSTPFVVYSVTTGNVQTETWTVQSLDHAVWHGTNMMGTVASNSNGTWTFSRSSGVWYEPPYSVTRKVKDGYWTHDVIGYETWCRGTDYNKPPNYFNHPGSCQYSKNTQYQKAIYGPYYYVPPVYRTYHYGGWHYGYFAFPEYNMINSLSDVKSYQMSLTDGKVTYAVNLVVDPIRPTIADFTMANDMVATQQPLSGLGINPTGNLMGATETWYVISQRGVQTYPTLSALNNASFTTSTDFTATVAHVVQIHNQTYVSMKDFTVKNMGFVKTTTGGVVHVTRIDLPVTGQTYPTDTLPVRVRAGGEVTYEITTIGPVASVTVTYSNGKTQTLRQGTPPNGYSKRWIGYYYPSSTQTIPAETPDGTVISISNIKVTATDGSFITATSPLLIVSNSLTNNGGKLPPVLEE